MEHQEEFETLLRGLLDGDLAAPERDRLAELCSIEESRARALSEAVAFDAMLGVLVRDAKDGSEPFY